MKTSSDLIDGYLRHGGAARVSLFFALWTGALFVLQELDVEASPVFAANAPAETPWWTAPAPPPAIDTAQFWARISDHSEVMNGSWRADTPDIAEANAPAAGADSTQPAREQKDAIEAGVAIAGVVATAPRAVVPDTPQAEPVRMERAKREDAGRIAKQEAREAIARGDDEAAYRILRAVEARIAPDRNHYDLLAAVMVRTARFEEAADVYAALIAGDASDPRLWTGYALALERIGHAEPSQIAYRNVMRTAAAGSALHELAAARLHLIG